LGVLRSADHPARRAIAGSASGIDAHALSEGSGAASQPLGQDSQLWQTGSPQIPQRRRVSVQHTAHSANPFPVSPNPKSPRSDMTLLSHAVVTGQVRTKALA